MAAGTQVEIKYDVTKLALAALSGPTLTPTNESLRPEDLGWIGSVSFETMQPIDDLRRHRTVTHGHRDYVVSKRPITHEFITALLRRGEDLYVIRDQDRGEEFNQSKLYRLKLDESGQISFRDSGTPNLDVPLSLYMSKRRAEMLCQALSSAGVMGYVEFLGSGPTL